MTNEYYVIVNLDDLTYMYEGRGGSIEKANKFETIKEAKEELKNYDDDFNGAIYKVIEYKSIKLKSDYMTNEQREAIELAKEFTKMDFSNKMGWTGYYDTELKELSQAIDTVLSLIKEQQEKMKNKDKQIDLMAELVYKRFKAELLLEYGFENEEQLKQYFAELVEKE